MCGWNWEKGWWANAKNVDCEIRGGVRWKGSILVKITTNNFERNQNLEGYRDLYGWRFCRKNTKWTKTTRFIESKRWRN